MRRGMKKVLAVVTLATVLLNNSFASITLRVNAEEAISGEEALKGLSNEEREALSKLKLSQANEGLMLNDDVNLQSEDEVSVIVEFKQKPVKVTEAEARLTGKKFSLFNEEKKVDDSHEKMKAHIDSMFELKSYSEENQYIKHSYKNALNGMAIILPGNRVEELLECDVVKAIYSNERFELDPVKVDETSSLSVKSVDSPELGVEKLHGENITGEGIKVGVLDTGIDYNHPDLKDSYKGGYDFVDNDDDPMETTYEEWQNSGESEFNDNGNTYYTHHGTHVSGIIAGQGVNESDNSKKGVAPDADLYVYRVLGEYGGGYSDDIIAAIDKSVEDGMDIINLSLGARTNNHLYPTSIAVNNAVLSGVVVAVSAGNSGPDDFTLGSPGTASLGITVGASSLDLNIPTVESMLNNESEVKYNLRLIARKQSDNIEELKGQEFNIVDVGSGAPYEYNGKDVEGKFVLVERGKYSLHSIIVLAKNMGASGVLLKNNNEGEGHIPHYLGEDMHYIPAFSISKEEGEFLKSKLTEESKIGFNSFGEFLLEGDTLGDFSSNGPVSISYEIKPEVVAPGVKIPSTVPFYAVGSEEGNYENAYKRLDGTSMSSPYVAGVAALMLQENQDMEPLEVKSRLMNTSEGLKNNYSVYEVGAGRIDPYEAVKSEVDVKVSGDVVVNEGENGILNIDDGDLNFGIITSSEENFSNSRSIKVENNSSEEKEFSIEVVKNKDVGLAKEWDSNGVTIDIANDLIVKGNNVSNLYLSVNIPAEAELGSYEGYVVLTNKNNPEEDYRVPFVVTKIEEGAEEFYLDANKLATPKGYYSRYIVGAATIFFSLETQAETIDFIVVDEETDKEIGLVTSLDASELLPKVKYRLEGFNGKYYPLTGDKDKPVAYELETLNTGSYKLRLVSRNSVEESFSKDYPFYIDNKLPEIKELTLNTAEGSVNLDKDFIYEYDPKIEKNFNLTGKFYDEDLAKMEAGGVDPYSRPNFENYYNISVTGMGTKAEIDREGNINATITPSPMGGPIRKVEIQAVDAAGNTSINDVRSVAFVKEGTKYASLVPEKNIYNEDEIPVITMGIKNVDDVKEIEFEYSLRDEVASLDTIELLPEFRDKATIEYTTEIDKYGFEVIKGKVSFNEPINSNEGRIEFAEFKLDNHNTRWYNSTMSIYSDATVVKHSDGSKENIRGLSQSYRNNPDDVFVRALPYWGEGLTYEISGITLPTLGGDFDYSTIGLEFTIEDGNGVKYETSFDDEADRYVTELPFENRQYKALYSLPGHFNVYRDFEIDRVDQIGITYFSNIDFELAKGGDVNKDNVIDINDALYISENYLSDDRNADINYDGVVNEDDFNYVVNNFLMKNPTFKDSPDGVESRHGIALANVAKDLEDGIGKSNLEVTIKDAEELVKEDYTVETWNKLENTLKESKEILAKEDSTQEEVKSSRIKLSEAVYGLEVEIKVEPPTNLRATNVNKKNVTLAWNKPEATYGLEGYVIYKDGKKIKEINNPDELEITAGNLKRHTIYNFKVAAKYSNRKISTKDSLTLRTAR